MTPFWKSVRQRAEAALAHGAYAVLSILPLDWASGLMGGLARAVGPHLGVSKVARRNLARAFPEKSAAEIEAIVAEAWENLGRVAGEFPHVEKIARERVELVGVEHIRALRDDGKPGLFIAGHLANWELPGAMVCREGLAMVEVYRAPNNPGIDSLFRRGRAHSATGGQIPKGPEGARKLVEVLRAGGHLGMLVDQKMNDGIAVPFFGRDAMTAPAAARFALKFDCPIAPVQVERLGGARFRVTIHPPLDLPRTGDNHGDTRAIMTRLNVLLEEWVRARPGQWLWVHRRWPD